MRLRVFKADKGDCLLLTSGDGRHVLVDGGMRRSYTDHVAPFLSRLHRRGERLDAVCITHIDRDHVWGVLQMLDDLVEWRVHEWQVRNGHRAHPRPASHRPPEVGEIWNNAFHEQADDNRGRIEDLLAAQARALGGHPDPAFRRLAGELADLATSEGDAIRLSRRAGDDQLGIPKNPQFGGGFIYHTPDGPMRVGRMRLTVIGPYLSELEELRERWNRWLDTHEAQLERIREAGRRDSDRLAHDELQLLIQPLLAQAEELAADPALAAAALPQEKVLGRRRSVTVPNLASLMLLAEEGRGRRRKRVLLTGDGHADDLVRGLIDAGRLREGGGLHVDVLKVPHHGSEHNTHAELCRTVTADHYVFCANGAHQNPDVEVVRAYLDARIGPAAARSPNPEARRPFKLWFTYRPDHPELSDEERRHLREVERLLDRRSRHGRLRFEFIPQSHRAIPV